MKIIVFGGSGFVGSHVSDALSRRGHQVTIFDLQPSAFRTSAQAFIQGDILKAEDVASALYGQDAAYNFAGFADLDGATTQPTSVAQLNIIGNLNILDACRRQNVKRFVYASTIYVYSESGGFYRCSKQASELFIEEYNRRYGTAFTILRYGTVYGPRADERNSMYRYLIQALRTGKVRFSGTGDEFREYIDVRDAANLSADALDDQYQNQRLIITGHQAIRVKDMFTTIFEILRKPTNIEFLGSTSGDHYTMTPYSYVPKVGKKLVSNYFTDIGQGLIECLTDIETRATDKTV